MAVRKICHLLAAVHFWFGCYYDWNYVKLPLDKNDNGQYPLLSGKLRFLTYWNALLQCFFFTICLLNDVLGTNEDIPKKTPWIRKFRDILLASLAFPISMFVAFTFWGIYLIDRELILPRVLDAVFPTWLNHLMHTNIAVFIVAELAMSFRQYPSRKLGLTPLLAVMLTYLVWIHVIYYQTGSWVYPILNVLDLKMRIVFFLSTFGLIVLLYIFGERLNSLIWKGQVNKLKLRKQK